MPTFKPRRRQLSPSRAASMARLAPTLCLEQTGPPIHLGDVFGRTAPVVLDIGIGSGDPFVDAAASDTDTDWIGADVHTPGIAATLERIDELALVNARLVHGDALRFIERLSAGSLDGIRIYFPDPWHKSRHRHRRLVNEANVERFADLLVPGGAVHVATDIDDYATQARRVLGAHRSFEGGVVDRPDWRPVTKYERKGLAAGRTVTDLVYTRTAD